MLNKRIFLKETKSVESQSRNFKSCIGKTLNNFRNETLIRDSNLNKNGFRINKTIKCTSTDDFFSGSMWEARQSKSKLVFST